MKKCIFLLLAFLPIGLGAQVIGNRAYQNASAQDTDPVGNAVQLARTDSTFLVQAKVLVHVPADEYLVTFGISQVGESPQECNAELNRRVSAFTGSLKSLGVKEPDIFVDLIAQSKVYDYQIEENVAEERLKGFKIQKNVIIRCQRHDQIARMLNLAAEQQIYDLVAVEYVSTDEEAIYSRLFDAAAEVIQRKRQAWLRLSGAEVKGAGRPCREHFYAMPPESRYRSYEAKDSGEVYSSNWERNYVVKRVPRERTFFYDSFNPSGFDRVLNPPPVEVGLAYVLELQLEYTLNK
ncbi:MAG: SIMPL domain-containing protein [Phaeodactylibacter sp.]|nr:SIMPL domain-containing protein [Phaeodactylibacter sp.]